LFPLFSLGRRPHSTFGLGLLFIGLWTSPPPHKASVLPVRWQQRGCFRSEGIRGPYVFFFLSFESRGEFSFFFLVHLARARHSPLFGVFFSSLLFHSSDHDPFFLSPSCAVAIRLFLLLWFSLCSFLLITRPLRRPCRNFCFLPLFPIDGASLGSFSLLTPDVRVKNRSST